MPPNAPIPNLGRVLEAATRNVPPGYDFDLSDDSQYLHIVHLDTKERWIHPLAGAIEAASKATKPEQLADIAKGLAEAFARVLVPHAAKLKAAAAPAPTREPGPAPERTAERPGSSSAGRPSPSTASSPRSPGGGFGR